MAERGEGIEIHEGGVEEVQLIRAALNGDFSAFEALVRRYENKAYRLAWSLMKNDSDAQDVVQEAFLNIYRKLDTFEGHSKFSSWVYRVVLNAALSRRRQEQRHVALSLDAAGEGRGLYSSSTTGNATLWSGRGDKVAETKELQLKILQAVDALDPKYQAVFLLREVEGLSMEDIGDVLDISVPAVKSRLHRARLFLRETLRNYLS